MKIPFNLLIEFGCFLVYLCHYRRLTGKLYKSLFWFLLFTVVIESLGYFLRFFLTKNNQWVYNLFLVAEIGFIASLLSVLLGPFLAIQKVNGWVGILLFIAYAMETISTHFQKYASITNSLFSVYVVIMCCLYFYYFLHSEEDIPILVHPPFWLISGLFFFYFGSSACNLFFDYLAMINLQHARPLRYFIMLLLNFILYGCWGYALLCQKKQSSSSLLS